MKSNCITKERSSQNSDVCYQSPNFFIFHFQKLGDHTYIILETAKFTLEANHAAAMCLV